MHRAPKVRPALRIGPTGRLACAAALMAIVGTAACGDLVVDGRGLEVDATGTIEGIVRLDLDGSGVIGGQDPPVPGVRILLRSASGSAVIDTATTDEEGRYRAPSVPVGELIVDVDPATLPGELSILQPGPDPVLLGAGQTVQRPFGLALPEFSVAEVRALQPGRVVFTRGIVMNQRPTPGDGVVHIRADGVALRVTGVPSVGLSVGDSVRVRGESARNATQPILASATVFRIGPSDVLVTPIEVGTGEAALAGAETLDAELVRIRNAVILDTIPDGGNLRVVANDGSGPVELLLREFLTFNRTQLVPGASILVQGAGLLVPHDDGTGQIRWRITPRAQGDLQVAPLPQP